MSVTTKQGDKGGTKLYGGSAASKSSKVVGVLGDLDELTVSLSASRLYLAKKVSTDIADIQRNLYLIGSVVAGFSSGNQVKAHLIAKTLALEQSIALMEKKLPALKNFILPFGCKSAVYLHVARVVCRRCERAIVGLLGASEKNKYLIGYINRLSDFLFTLARFENYNHTITEELATLRPQ
ncbi:TPA: cob(I)yrinic acid a,c-diamide adenosyltransferase [candidate division WWE3 bacterium]|uniref:Corrinoid adenosyltransferase n=5 Tax=Katanobacteria TaxID=422282 RepID=A0A0G1KIV2_UNCKA|nr:MAG: hypothetical protein UW36_C0003G0019 [candidate division WWE3 bacterium GW2011_GWA2_44_16]KKT69576.1 MAG: hypothetical protein UW65_C0019G0003 [candidate division WWE3 bacterium GW2011_GWB1_44_4]KKT83596.1 MAG: hypothetical protein UW82_C0036G0002 [candidate division WWE3 bacterium GW2011_GWC2_44_9]OGC51173.1 MAG: ATP:cob(I)alamin adenosyltransferase [candidate division WWE3 bacterium RIFCSPHIGHO2_01_FULL_43_9]HAZ29869.1 cob(I)yrinic acid a,c-diamide adenosyltransferase [candidate divis